MLHLLAVEPIVPFVRAAQMDFRPVRRINNISLKAIHSTGDQKETKLTAGAGDNEILNEKF